MPTEVTRQRKAGRSSLLKTRRINVAFVVGVTIWLRSFIAPAQILMSAGGYSQNFDSLATSGTGNAWANNVTLAGWYVSKNNTNAASYRAGDGSSNTGDPWSYGVAGVSNLTERAFGSLASGTATPIAYGVRFTNDTAVAQTNITISYTGEQWRSGSLAANQSLAFAYAVSSTPITNAANAAAWINFSALNFVSPNLSATASALDGNAATNRQVFSAVLLAGVSVPPGQELFLRWLDVDDTGFDSGLAVDDLVVTFNNGGSQMPAAPVITAQPQSQTVTQGASVTLTVAATGFPAPEYQWQFNSTDIAGATNATLTLNPMTLTNAGDYRAMVTNSEGTTNSQIATLTVTPPVAPVAGFTLMTYNTHGNFVSDWTTNSLQVQAIGRQVEYLNPDIITFQEIPLTNSGWTHMPEFVAAFRPGFFLATNSGSDGFIRSVILSRYPITRSKSWLDGADLNPFGYTNANFTRDLFEAQIAVPGFPQPVHVFTTHLKSGQVLDDSNRRTAEAGAISNYFVTGFLTTNSLHTYLLTGDMNEDITRPPSSNPQSIQKLISTPTGLRLTTPLNPFTGSEMTFSIQAASLTKRYDYIMPGGLLFSNIASSQVFRTDLLPSPPPPLLAGDGETASDHLPVLMVFNNPYDKPFKLLSIARSNVTVTLKWESVPGQPYRVDASTNLAAWSVLASNLTATSNTHTFSTNLNDATRYFRVYRVP